MRPIQFQVVWWITTFIHACECASYDEVNVFKKQLLQDYNKNTFPVLNQSRPIIVYVDLVVKNIISFDEKLGILRSISAFGLFWTDEKLRWNATDVGIEFLSFPPDAIWQPKLFLQNSVTEEWLINTGAKGEFEPVVYANGSVLVGYAGLTETKCDADIFHYPFDRHSCSWDLLSGSSVQSMVVQSITYGLQLPHDTNKEWIVENITRKNTVLKSSFTVSRVIFTCTFKRRPSFLILNILTPIIGLGLLNPIVFALPESSGERVSLSVTILLTLVFYLNMIADRLPPINDPISMLNISVMIQAGNSIIILICAIVTMIIFDKNSNNASVPTLIQKMAARFECLDKNFIKKKNKNRINSECNVVKSNVKVINIENCDLCSPQSEEILTEPRDSVTWKTAGRQVNRVFLRLFTFIIVMNWILYVLIILIGSEYH